MKKIICIIFLGLILIMLSGFTIKEQLSPIIEDQSTQEIAFVDGNKALFSHLTNSGIGIIGFRDQSGDLIFQIVCQNNMDKPLNFIPENITVSGFNKANKEKPLLVYSALDYVKKMKSKQEWALVGKALSNSIDSYNAGRSSSYGSIYASDGLTSVYGSTYSNTYDASKAAEIDNKNQQELDQMKNQFDKNLQELYVTLLKANTLAPKQITEGYLPVKYDWQYKNFIIVNIPIENEIHKIKFAFSKQK